MTRAVRDRILKDVNGNISDHLRNHIHLTNCIHLKNHMHKHSPMLTDRALMRELVVLQRSRSLRDPSTSPRSWHSPAVDALLRTGERDALVSGRRSVGIERPRDGGGIEISPPSKEGQSSHGLNRHKDRALPAVSNHSSKSVIGEHRRGKREESSGRFLGNDVIGWNHEHPRGKNDTSSHDRVSGKSDSREKNIVPTGRNRQDEHLKSLSDQLNEVHEESDKAASSRNHGNGKIARTGKNSERAGASSSGYHSGSTRIKRRKFRGARRTRLASAASQDDGTQNEISVASNSFAQFGRHQKYHLEKGDKDYADETATGIPRNGCGIPWNWSRIHHRGKSFLDMAGRSLSCGLSDSRTKMGGSDPRGRDILERPVMSEHSSSSTKSDAEALPLLVDASESQGSMENAAWQHDYSGELGIYADNLLKRELDSDLVSEGRSGEQYKFRRHRNGRHQNLTQKYMPRTFRDLVGQNLVAQALSNAVIRRKVSLLYVFYGPHGTGKTSTASIFARALNCLSLEHSKPCGFCDSCISYENGKSRNVKEIGVSNFDFESIADLLDSMVVSHLPSQYRVLIFDECDTLSHDCWSAILKVIDRAPKRVVFILISSSLDVLPHIILSRCQKFFFPKLKDADIIYSLQWIAAKEDLEIDKDALKLIASRSDGSLRDAEMTLEQLSLLGQRISVPLVQELVGLISDEKLVDLLDLALSADTVNTVKNLRDIMESGIEPLAFMSQLATVITDILAGSYDVMKERSRRKFFRSRALSKEDMEKLRQALKTLSEAEKQLRMSNDKTTWLTAALLQLAPDQQYMLRNSSADASINHSPPGLSNSALRNGQRRDSVIHTEMPNSQAGNSRDIYHTARMKGTSTARAPQRVHGASEDKNKATSVQVESKSGNEIEEIWLDVLQKIPINGIKEFLYREGKLISVSFGTAPTVQLVFSSQLTKSKAEKFREHILQAFESVLQSPVTIEIRSESNRHVTGGPIMLRGSEEISSRLLPSNGMPRTGNENIRSLQHGGDGPSQSQFDITGMGQREIVEVEASPREPKGSETKNEKAHFDRRNTGISFADQRKLRERNHNLSLVRGKVSLAHVIQHAEGCSQQSGWSKRKAVSIAEKLEQENLRLEPRSRSLLCWRVPRVTRRKLSHLRVRTRKPKALLKFVSCGRCLSSRSPR